jgi:predicted ABC-type ATPase
MSIADETIVYDNSGPEPRLILEIRSGSIVCNAGEPPPWARNLLEDVHL